jgi:hypothetical protein
LGEFKMSENNALGVLGLETQLTSRAVHPRQTWIDGWNFSPAGQYIRGSGDMDGDGRDEFVITSDWGIGLLEHEGGRFRCPFGSPRDTWFGGWRYDASINPGRDRIMAVQNFTGSAKRELLVWSSWGMTTLEFTGSMTPTRIHANGVRLGGWVLNTADNWYAGSGRFDSDSRHDMALTSPWGLGLISLQAGTSIFMAANGSRLGDWQLDTRSDRIHLIADFDGDGRDEIVIGGRRGIAVLKLVENRLIAIALHEFGANLGGYLLGSTDHFVLADRFRGTAAQILVVSPTSGLHMLRLEGNRLERQAFAANGTRIDGWVIDAVNNTVHAAGDMTGDGAADFLIRSPWGIGIMSLDTANRIRCRTLHPYGATLGEWFLESSDIIAGSGKFIQSDRSELLVVKPWVNSERSTSFTTRDFTNWHGNIVRRSIQTVQPKSLAELVTAVKTIQERGNSVGIMGSGWSFTDCAVSSRTEVVIDTSSLSAVLGGLVPDILDNRPTMNGANRLVHVEAGIKLFDLNCKLEALGLALPTMGGSRGQSLAGVLSTGVHGADVNLPPIADAVRAIHLVGPNGQQWWIEPATRSVSTRSMLERAKARGILDPSIKNVYDNEWFNAALVAVGCAGVIYSVVIECRPAFRLSSTTLGESWAQAQQRIRDLSFPDRRPRYLEINVNPTDQSCRVTVRQETTEAERPPTGGGGMSMCETIAALGFIGPGALGLFFGAIGDYIARTSAEIAALHLIPGAGPFLAAQKTVEALKPVEDAHRLLVELNLVAVDPHNPRRVADVLPTALNLIWAIGAFVVSGRSLVDQLQRELTSQQRPDQSWVGKSFQVMTGQPNCSESGVQNHDEVARLVESYEYAVPANRAIAFIDRLIAVIAELRRQQDAIVVNLNLRFTGRTRATLGMQVFEQTCHVEIYTFRGLRGNEAFKQRMYQVVREFNAVPHWGQFHNQEDATAFGAALGRWQRVIQAISGGNELFWSDFARSRGLL